MKLKSLTILMAVAVVLGMFAGCGIFGDKDPSSPAPDVSDSYPPDSMPESSPPEAPVTPPSSTPAEDTLPKSGNVRATLSTDFTEIGAYNASPVTWGPGVRKNAAGRSEACDLLQAVYGKMDALFIGPDEKTVYLTFDQGYENGYTEAILDILKEKNVKAVFFLTGHYVNSRPDLVQRMIDDGHVLGNHSYDHPNFATAKPEDAFADLTELHEAVYNNFGVSMDLFRFPEGAFSEQSLALIQSTGYTSVFWSFAYRDWDPANQIAPADALERVMEGAHNGCIFLFHTVGETNSLILGDVIDNLRAEGYGFDVVRPVQRNNDPAPTTSSAAPGSSPAPQEENIFLRPWP